MKYFTLIVLFFLMTVQTLYACDCEAPPNNPTQILNLNDVVLGASKSYVSSCGDYRLEVQVIPSSSPYPSSNSCYYDLPGGDPNGCGPATHTGSFVTNPGAVALPSITIPFNTLTPGETYKWRVRILGGVGGSFDLQCSLDFTDGGVFTVPSQIPTMSQWGLFILGLIMTSLAVVKIRRGALALS